MAKINDILTRIKQYFTKEAEDRASADSALDSAKADKIANGTENNIVLLDANGNIKDSGKSLNDTGKIDTISINGVDVQVDQNKNVDLPAYPTKESLGLDNVDNTSDSNKPVSTAQQTALDLKEDKANIVKSTDGWGQTPSDTKYPSEKLVKDNLDLKENTSNKVSAFQATPDNNHYPTEKLVKDNLDLKALITETGNKIDLEIDSSTYKIKAKLYDKNNTLISTSTEIDLPLESVVVSGYYDSSTKEVVLTLQSGSVVRFSVADLISGLQSEITSTNKLSSDLVDDTNHTNKFVTASEKSQITTNQTDISNIKDGTSIDSFADVESALSGKQNTLTFDSSPTENSNNPVTSGGVYEALQRTKDIYGVKRLTTQSSSAWERTDSNTASVNFDTVYPWSDIISVNYDKTLGITAKYGDSNFAFDGSNGEVMTYIPEFWYRRYVDNNVEYIQISKHHFTKAKKSEAFYLGRYTTSSGTRSISGVTSTVSTDIATFRSNAKAIGDGWGIMDYHIFFIQMLYLVEYADYNSQSVLGQGVCSASTQVSSGGCDSLGMSSGCITNDGVSSVIYRGLENIFGNIWQFIDGITIVDHQAYVSYNQNDYVNAKTTGSYRMLGYVNATSDGYPTNLGYDSDNEIVAFPTAVGGSSSTYMCDYYWQSAGTRLAVFGGAWNAGASDGFFCWYLLADFSVSTTSVGSRLLLTI